MVITFTRHGVDDYDAWRAVYEGFHERRRGLGAKDEGAVFRTVSNPNEVTVVHEFETLELAEAFVSSPELRERMESAGVRWPADFWIVEED
ncbi:MAG: cyclase [Solirubrobacterales bacterium]